MKHLGDITKISGYDAPIVDCVIGGSPCQDLSVSGKRAGLDGERSGLFMEQIRLIKEMRENDRQRSDYDVRPRYMLWENVPGALSSAKGEDFRRVLEEVARIVEEGVAIPQPQKGKWTTSGCILGDGYSIAWRMFDAQYWGVPQRRRRICLLADFNGYTAAEILFNKCEHNGVSDNPDRKSSVGNPRNESRPEVQSVSESLPRNTQQGAETWQGTSSALEDSVRASNSVTYCLQGNGIERADTAGCNGKGWTEDVSYTLNTTDRPAVVAIDMGGGKSACCLYEDCSPTLACTHYGEPAVVYDARGNGNGDIVPTLAGDHQNRITDYTGVVITPFRKQGHPRNAEEGQGWEEADKADTLNIFDNSESRTPTVVVMDRAAFNQGKNAQYDFLAEESETAPTCVAKGPSAVAYAYPMTNDDKVYSLDAHYAQMPGCRGGIERTMVYATDGIRYIVRRLTPLECERLQGYPDGWTDIGEYVNTKGKKCKTSDASRYKAHGNTIAIPSWRWVIKRICAEYERPATMASLFDGIGGFPLIWESINGRGTCLWASEIEEFPIAVTKERIGE